ncbi:hypothetical protein F4779DRAFT_543532 [Xylariaceae sp. FL0662B]|nr:hypothetical protein F4779DRAFT_543532 [Xylariaceae sp. FL0662B]
MFLYPFNLMGCGFLIYSPFLVLIGIGYWLWIHGNSISVMTGSRIDMALLLETEHSTYIFSSSVFLFLNAKDGATAGIEREELQGSLYGPFFFLLALLLTTFQVRSPKTSFSILYEVERNFRASRVRGTMLESANERQTASAATRP